ncbi:MAG TPA: HAD hydrolase-like protein, partial [Fibrella sp.]
QLGPSHAQLTAHVDASYQRFTEVLEAHYLTHDITPTAGCLDAFAFLREQEIAIALTTGFYRKVTDIILKKLGWLEGLNAGYVGTKQSVIQVSIASDEVPQGRPEPLMIQKAMHLLGITNPEVVVNVGDTPSDLLSGRTAGVGLNLGVINGTHSREQLIIYPHDQLIGSLAELPSSLSIIH